MDQLIARDAGDGLDEVFGVISKDEADRLRATIADLRLEWERK